MMPEKPFVGEHYKHYKNGRIYVVQYLAMNVTNGEPLTDGEFPVKTSPQPVDYSPDTVIYQDVETAHIYSRAVNEWFELVPVGPPQGTVARFSKVLNPVVPTTLPVMKAE